MKLKNILYLIIFMPITILEAKGGKAAANKPAPARLAPQQGQQKPAPQQQRQPQTKETYTSLLLYIRNASPQTIFKDGKFTDNFIAKIKSAQLGQAPIQALLEAGRNLHMPLSGNDQENSNLISQTNQMIDKTINNWSAPANMPANQPAPSPQQQPAKGGQPHTPNLKPIENIPASLYNPTTGLFNENSLNKLIQMSIDSGVQPNRLFDAINNQYRAVITRNWTQDNDIQTLERELTQQIYQALYVQYLNYYFSHGINNLLDAFEVDTKNPKQLKKLLSFAERADKRKIFGTNLNADGIISRAAEKLREIDSKICTTEMSSYIFNAIILGLRNAGFILTNEQDIRSELKDYIHSRKLNRTDEEINNPGHCPPVAEIE